MRSCFSLFVHSHEPKVLVLPGDDGWSLPSFPAQYITDLNRTVSDWLGTAAITLRCLLDQERYGDAGGPLIYLHEPQAVPQLPAGARWLALADLASTAIVPADHQRIVASVLWELEGGPERPDRAQWEQRGWHREACGWLADEMAQLGHQVTGPTEQVQVRVWSCVLRASTTRGDVYLKASPACTRFESALTGALADWQPDHIPEVLAVNPDRDWLLLASAGELMRPLLPENPLTMWKDALAAYAQLQIALVPHADAALALGCPDRRLAGLTAQFVALCDELEVLPVQNGADLARDDLPQLRAFAPQVRAMCAQLAATGFPETLHHDDLHPGNICLRGEQYVVFDWGECAITHPLLSLFIPLRWARIIGGMPDDMLAQLTEAYCAPWRIALPQADIAAALPVAQRLAVLSRALSWGALARAAPVDDRWESLDSALYWLRLFVTGIETD